MTSPVTHATADGGTLASPGDSQLIEAEADKKDVVEMAPAALSSTDRVPEASKARSIVICIAGTAIVFISSGTLFAVGVYQDLYESLSKEPGNPFSGATSAQISLIGALGGSFMSIGAPFVTAWTRQFSPRAIVTSGGIAFGLASVLASFGTALWHFQLSQGLLFGLGTCNAFVPAMTVPPTWYTRRRALAMGFISAGTGIGGLVWAPALQALIDTVGYRDTLRISGGITGGLLVIAALFLDWDPETKARLRLANAADPRSWHRRMWDIHLINWHTARTRQFAAQLLATTAQSTAYYTPVFFLSAFARTFGFTPAQGANFIAISNACNALSKILAGWIADRIGRLRMLMILTVLTTVSIFAVWLPSTLVADRNTGRALYIAFVICYGMFASPYVALFPATLVDLFGAKEFSEVNGALYLIRGLATLVGLPVSGALVRWTGTTMDNESPSAYMGVAVFIGALFVTTCLGNSWIWFEARSAKRLARSRPSTA